MALLSIQNLHVSVDGTPILKGIDLTIEPGKTHAIMGPNGSGKSTLSYTIAGRPGYEITQGVITLDGQDIAAMEPDERAAAGLFLAFQYPVEIPGVSVSTFLKTAVNSLRKKRGEDELDALAFVKALRSKAKDLGVPDEMLKRPLNVGFSGGEKKRIEMLQMVVLAPRMVILDETDSGLDIDALKTVADGVNAVRDPERGLLVITHYQRLLNHIVPDVVHVLAKGRIIKTGGKELAHELEANGYAGVLEDAA